MPRSICDIDVLTSGKVLILKLKFLSKPDEKNETDGTKSTPSKPRRDKLSPPKSPATSARPAGDVVIPHGANAQIIIRSPTKGGRIKGTSVLVLDLASVSVDGRMYQLSTTDLVKQGKTGMGANKRTAEYTGGGAAIGAIIGAIAGRGNGAAIGAASGAGAGAITQIATKGGSIKAPETVLTFKLDQPLRVVAAP